MNVGVLLHVALLMKPFAAVRAGVWSSITMNEEVRGQRAGPLERLATLFALKHFLHVVHSPRMEMRSTKYRSLNIVGYLSLPP